MARWSSSRSRCGSADYTKQLVPVASNPVLFYGLEAIRDAGITDMGIVVGDTVHDAVSQLEPSCGVNSRSPVLLAGGYPGFEHARLIVLDKLTYAGNLANLAPVADEDRFTFVQGDICDFSLLASVVPGHDVVVNFAAETHVDKSIGGASDFVAANVAGVQVLLDVCLVAEVGRVVQVSTDEVYGSLDQTASKGPEVGRGQNLG